MSKDKNNDSKLSVNIERGVGGGGIAQDGFGWVPPAGSPEIIKKSFDSKMTNAFGGHTDNTGNGSKQNAGSSGTSSGQQGTSRKSLRDGE